MSRRIAALAWGVALAGSLASPPARGATINVSTFADLVGPGAGCSLREAVISANTDTSSGGCTAGAGADLVVIPAGTYFLSIAGRDEDAAAQGDLDLTSEVIIEGAGANSTTLQVFSTDRAFTVMSGIQVEIRDLHIKNGLVTPGNGTHQYHGGAILNDGDLTLSHVWLEGNAVEGDDGGLLSGGYGGAIYNGSSATLAIYDSTLSDNEARGGDGADGSTTGGGGAGGGGAGLGGAIYNAGTLTLTNTTVSGNSVVGGAGGEGRSNGGVVSASGGNGGGIGGVGGSSTGSQGFAGGAGLFLGGGGGGGGSSVIVGGSGGAGRFGGGGGGGGAKTGTVPPGGCGGAGGGGTDGGGDGGQDCCNGGGGGGGGGALGAGLYHQGGALTLNNVTIVGNQASGGSGGSDAACGTQGQGQNGTGTGGGLYAFSSNTIVVRNSIVIGNSADDDTNCSGSITSGGYNLVGSTCPTSGTGDQSTVDPLLGTLADNGGSTPTHALLTGSLAIDTGSPSTPGSGGTACEAADQRGIFRPQGTRCDKGAYELGRPEISVSKSAPSPVVAGQTFDYTVTVSNNGGAAMAGVVITDTLPSSVSLVSTSVPCSGTTVVTCSLGTVGAGALFAVTIRVQLDAATTASSITNSVSVTPTDFNPGNNSASRVTSVSRSADLSLTLVDSPDPVDAGSNLTYTLTVSNAGPSNAQGVVITHTLPSSVTLLSAPGCTAVGSVLTCSLGTVAAGGSQQVTVTTQVAAAASGTLSSGASVTATTSDPNAGNNSATAVTSVVKRVDLVIAKTDGVTSATPGGSVTYTVTVTNNGPNEVLGAVVRDLFPSSLSCIWTCSATGTGACRPGQVADDIDDEPINLPVTGVATFTAICSIAASATGSLSNTATVTVPTGFFDPVTVNNTAADLDTVLVRTADLSITKTDGVSSAVPGQALTYTIVASNAGPSLVTGATVTDPFPSALGSCTWSCVASAGSSCRTTPAAGNLSDTVTLPSGGTATYTATCTIGSAQTGTLANTATIAAPSGSTDPTPGNNSYSDIDTVLAPRGDLSITKTDGVTSAVPGQTVTYTVRVTNPGPSTATGVTVADSFPSTLSCIWSCTPAAGAICQSGQAAGAIADSATLPPVSSATYTAVCTIASTATGTLVNTASVSAPSGFTDTNSGNNSASDLDTVLTPRADLSISKTDGVTQAAPGGSVTYTIVVSNASGPSQASSVTVQDLFPSSLLCSWGCTGVGGAVCTPGQVVGSLADTVTLPVGSSARYTATCTIDSFASGTLANTATVTAPFGVDFNPGNDSASDLNTALVSSADLTVSLTDGVSSAVPGSSVTYTLTAGNNGPNNVFATVVDTFPASLSCLWTCASAGSATCTPGHAAGNIADAVRLPMGGTVTYTAVCSIHPSATGTLVNTATVTSSAGVVDPTPLNNTASDLNTVLTPTADLSITKTDGVSAAVPGQALTYTIVASNAGPSSVTGATVTDPFPSALGACTWSCVASAGASCRSTPAAGNLSDTVTLPSGGTATYTATCTIGSAQTGTLANTATIAAPSGSTDPTPGNNSYSDIDTVLAPRADLAITKTDGVTSAVPGQTVTYTVQLTNPGPSTATGATVSDSFPSTLSCTWSCTPAGGAVCRSGQAAGAISDSATLPPVSSATYTAVCTIASTATGTLVNTASVSVPSGFTDTNSGNNSATDLDTVLTPRADLSISKTDGVTSAAPGGSVTYTIVVSNPVGPSQASSVTVEDLFPTQLICSWGCTGVSGAICTPGQVVGNIQDTVSLPVGSSARYTATCTIDSFASGTLANTATVAAPFGVDFNPGNDSASDLNTALVSSADLTVSVTDGVASAVPGSSITYTLAAGNNGPNDVFATVVDTFPASLSCLWTCVGAGGATCTPGQAAGNIADAVRLPMGGTVTYTAQCSINPSAVGTLVNTATVSGAAGVVDPTPLNNSASDLNTVLAPQADLAITKDDGQSAAGPGGAVTYTVTVTNASGPSAITGATVRDTFPSTLTCTWTCTGAGGAGCTGGPVSGNIQDTVSLPPGGSVTYTVPCSISAAASGTLTNTATVSLPAGTTDPVSTNNSATDSDPLTLGADLSLSKECSADEVALGEGLTYTLTVDNLGPLAATGVMITDTLPDGISLGSPLPSGDPDLIFADGFETGDTSMWDLTVGGAAVTCSSEGRTVTCNVGSLANGASRVLTLQARVDDDASGTLTNSATVESASFDPDASNDTATAAATVVLSPIDLDLELTGAPGAVAPGGTLTYTAVVTNLGPASATHVQLSDPLPPEVTAFLAVPNQGSCALGPEVQCALGTVRVGDSATVVITVAVSAGATGALTNAASVIGDQSEFDLVNNTATATTTILGTLAPASAPAVLDLGSTSPP